MAKSDYDTGGTGEGPSGEDGPQFTFPGTDIYAEWALGPGRADFFVFEEEQDWFPILIELTGITVQDFAEGKAKNGENFLPEENWSTIVRVPGLYRSGNFVADPVYLTIMVRERFLRILDKNKDLRASVPRLTLGAPLSLSPLDPTLFAPETADDYAFPPPPDIRGNDPSENIAIIGVIDDGLAFAHERFRDDVTSTRVHYAWLQDREFNTFGLVPFGKELTKNDIDTALGNQADDLAVYKELDALNFGRLTRPINHKSIAHRISHGSHVMDLAAGYNRHRPGEIHPDLPTEYELPIICVQLPTEVTANTSGGSLVPYVNLAIDYIIYRADFIADKMNVGAIPVVINFSYGHHSGPHDGTELLEAAIDQTIRARRAAYPDVDCNIVISAGNSHLTRTHAQLSFQRVGETRILDYRVLPDDRTPSFLEIWLPRGPASNRIEVRVTSPAGETSLAFGETPGSVERLPLGVAADSEYCLINYQHEPPKSAPASDRGRFLIALRPTRRTEQLSEPVAPAGLWRIHLVNLGLATDDIVHAWIGRDDTPLGFPIRGRQSYFDHADYEVYDDNGRYVETVDPSCPVKRAGTISGIATAEETVVIGGYYRKPIYRVEDGLETDRLAEYSAGGPTNDAPNRSDPDTIAVSEDSRVHRGVLAAGTQSGSTVSLNATSVAAPQVTRLIATEMAQGNSVDRSVVQSWADAADPPPPVGRPYPRWGYGRIETPPVRPQKRYEPWLP